MKISSEIVAINEQRPFKVSIFHERNPHPLHYHKSSYEIALAVNFRGTRIVGDSVEQIAQNDLVLMAPGLPHCWLSGKAESRDQQVVVFQFNNSIFSSDQLQADHLKSVKQALENAHFGLELQEEAKAPIVRELIEMDEHDHLSNYLLLVKVLDLFGSKHARKLCSKGYSVEKLTKSDKRFDLVHDYIIKNFRSKIAIEKVADLIHMTPTAFSQYFKKRTLMSFTDFILELRLGTAAQLLQNGETPITQIAYESGFANLSNFNRQFKKKYNCRPLEFRKLHQKIG